MEFPFKIIKQGIVNNCGITEQLLEEAELEWISINGDSLKSKKDFFWDLYNKLLNSYAKELSHSPIEMFQSMRKVYCEMFSFLCKEGKKRTIAQKGILNCDIQLAILSEIKLNAKIIGVNDCDLSKDFEGKIFQVKELTTLNLLPNMNCKRLGGCICCYGLIPIFD